MEECPICIGSGEVYEPAIDNTVVCPECQGTGEIK